MKFVLLIAFVLPLCLVSFAMDAKRREDFSFDEFVSRYKKSYPTEKEKEQRRQIFESNRHRITQFRLAHPTAQFGVNRFSDLTETEFQKKHLTGLKRNEKYAEIHKELSKSYRPPSLDVSNRNLPVIPSVIDWRRKGAVTPVPNEGDCGNIICGFGLMTCVEGRNKIVNGALVPLSAQEAMVCDEVGCGCDPYSTFGFFLNKTDGWVCTEKSWPLDLSVCETGTCDKLSTCVRGAQFDQMVVIPQNEQSMTVEVAQGPIFVGVNAIQWQFYTGGVLENCTSSDPNHVGGVVGYNNDVAQPYWILKNWWGADWGLSGYIYIGKGSNQCDITDIPLTTHVPKQP